MVNQTEKLTDKNGLDLAEVMNSKGCHEKSIELATKVVDAWGAEEGKRTTQGALARILAAMKVLQAETALFGLQHRLVLDPEKWDGWRDSVAANVARGIDHARKRTLRMMAAGEGPGKDAPENVRKSAQQMLEVEEACEEFASFIASKLSKAADKSKDDESEVSVIIVGPDGPVAADSPVVGIKSNDPNRPHSQWES